MRQRRKGERVDVTRRRLVVGMGAAGFALAAGPVSAQVITTPSEGLITADHRVRSGADSVPVYEARPSAAGRHPVVIVIHEIFGLHEHQRDVARRFAREGYAAFAPDLFSREGVAQMSDFGKVREVVGKIADRQVLQDLVATAEFGSRQPYARAGRVGATGFCWGGRITWLFAATYKELDAAVVWYGRIASPQKDDLHPKDPLDLAAEVACPVLGLYGEADTGIPVADVRKMEAALKRAGKAAEFVVYPGAPHAFFADYRPSYRPEAAKDGWQQALAWFARYLKA
ncbi:MAG: dienelactone hydrolase family protein [candidate division NC10 bacterium]|nr:dienelactone hydrolase family protein [candidate division NC10 bacterium]MBI3080280.1 dienelactone hydrolase family protein [candidate division NC10 bacterium]MBI4412834.1 dienelactone hydrolase family protein [candidate division NC10 bacterium]